MTEHGSPYVDEPHPDGSCAQGAGRSGPEPMDPVARVDLQRAQQARYGTEPHPDAALFASRLTRVVADSPAGSTPAGLPSGAGAPPPPGPAADGVAAAGVPASVGTPRASATAPPAGPAALTALPGERDESTVKLTPAGPTRPRPRPSPRPRALGLVTGAGEPPLGIVEGPASATSSNPPGSIPPVRRCVSASSSRSPPRPPPSCATARTGSSR